MKDSNSTASQILQKREIQGLRIMLWAFIIFILGVFPGLFFFTAGGFELVFTLALNAVALVIVFLGFLFLRDPCRVNLVGYGLVILSWLVMNILPWVWYHSIGGDIHPLGYFLKTTYTALSVIFIALTGLALNPRYPLLLTLGISVTWAWYIFQAAMDPKTQWTADYVKGVFGPSVDINLLGWQTICLVVMGILTTAASALARNSVKEAVSLETSNGQLARYFSPNIVKELQDQKKALSQPGGSLQKVAVLFADIRDFTTLTENMAPDEVLSLLSEYHQAMVETIFANEGTLDKFIGDGIMATFGTPHPREDDALRAVRAGLGMIASLEKLNTNRAVVGKAPLKIGIGIHYGLVLAGNVGTPQRLEYTVLGDTVNVASRIEGLCKETGCSFLISSEVKECLPSSIRCENLGKKAVKGRLEMVEVWAPEFTPGT